MAQSPDFIPFGGGLDLRTRPLGRNPGRAIGGRNYVSVPEGYRRIGGFERLDGRPAPSDATYWVLRFTGGDQAVSAGDVVTVGGETGIALIDGVLESGSYAGGDAAGYLVLSEVSGSMPTATPILVSAVQVATTVGAAEVRGADDATSDQTWSEAARDRRRALIQAVPGAGPITGLFTLKGSIYAIRDTGGFGGLYRATASGWTQVTLGSSLWFDSGTAAPLVGDVVTGGTSGATGTIRRVTLYDGDWNGTAAGYLILDSVTGTFQNAEALTTLGGGAMAAKGAQVAVGLYGGGRYDITIKNFYGDPSREAAYLANGQGHAAEFDGATWAPIVTGLPTAFDTPQHVAAFQKHLFLGYDAGTVQFSGIGEPLIFSPTFGAGEVAVGRPVTGFAEAASTVLAIYTDTGSGYMQGTSALDFTYQDLFENAGAVRWTSQTVGRPVYADSAAVRVLDPSDVLGGFRLGSLTSRINPLIERQARAGRRYVASARVRAFDQYWLWRDDGVGLCFYFGAEDVEPMLFDLGFVPTTVWAAPWIDGGDIILAGDENGFVYRLDRGTSFDGQEIEAYLRPAYHHGRNPRQYKRWHSGTLELEAASPIEIGVSADYSYGDPDQPSTGESLVETDVALGGYWDESNWDQFYWSSQATGTLDFELRGEGQSVSVSVYSKGKSEPHTLSSMTLMRSNRKLKRR